jgi:hypothetical protein
MTARSGHWTREIHIGDTCDDGGDDCLRRCGDDPTCAASIWTRLGAGGVFACWFLQAPGQVTMGCAERVRAVVRPQLEGLGQEGPAIEGLQVSGPWLSGPYLSGPYLSGFKVTDREIV